MLALRLRITRLPGVSNIIIFASICAAFNAVGGQQFQQQQRCSNRLENALEHMRRRSISNVKSSRTLWNQHQTPYQLYHSIYGQQGEPEDDFYSAAGGDSHAGDIDDGRGYYAKKIHRKGRPYPFAETDLDHLLAKRQPHKLAISRVDVEDLKVRVPPSKSASRWVQIDKCKFSIENSTLDTRLIFPDLTLSGKIVLQPTGGKCNMILRLRHAGIEFRTIPIGFETATHEESRRLGAASVRTDSHFAEPGFISVFAHACQGPSGIRVRQNSKRRFGYAGGAEPPRVSPEVSLSEPYVVMGSVPGSHRWGKYQNVYDQANYDIRTETYLHQHQRKQQATDLNLNESNSDSKEFFDIDGDNFYRRQFRHRRRRRAVDTNRHMRQYLDETLPDEMHFNDDILNFSDDYLQELVQADARAFADIFSGGAGTSIAGDELVGDALANELEKLFSMGVRSLLTTYMQRALQPAIKETLMENMGYTLSYG